jgi:hypothetical protein
MIGAEVILKHKMHQNSVGLLSIIMACIAFALFDPLKVMISKFADKLIFKSPDYHSLISGIETEISTATTLHEVSTGLIKQFKKIWDIEHAGFAIWDSINASYRLWPNESFQNSPIKKLNETIGKSDYLIKTLESERRLFKFGIVLEEELTAIGSRSFAGERITFWKIRRTMRWIQAEICVPLMFKNQLIGFIALGIKRNKALYNDEDKKFLSHISTLLCDAIMDKYIMQTNEMIA